MCTPSKPNLPTRPGHAPRTGFTLIELLVVITIVSLLVAMLLPSINRAKDLARTVVCKSKQHMIGLAFANYLGDNRGIYPYANPARYNYWSGGYSWSAAYCYPWQMAIRKYLGDYRAGQTVKILLCDANPWPAYVVNAQSDPATSFGLNASAFPSNWGDQSGIDPINFPSHRIPNMRETNLKAPSTVLLLAEVPNSAAASNQWGWNMATNVTEYVPFSGPTYRDPQSSGGYWLSAQIAIRVSGGTPCARTSHDLSWNALMADAHVQIDSRASLIALTSNTWAWNRYWFNR